MLADIGNTHIHIFEGEDVVHLPHKEAIERYGNEKIFYISVNEALEARICQNTQWHNVNDRISLPGQYETMGVDRKALCLSRESGMFVDAGSAVTVDVVKEGVYRGGFILPGLKAYMESYRAISPVLETTLDTISLSAALPRTTKEQMSYGIIASIQSLIQKHRGDEALYFTGGDGAFLSTFFDGASYDETLVFQGMKYALRASDKLEMKN
jgi:type III pantothenate kinase